MISVKSECHPSTIGMKHYRKYILVTLVAGVLVVSVALVRLNAGPEEIMLDSHYAKNVLPYPHFYYVNVSVEEREGLTAYLRVRVWIYGIPGSVVYWSVSEFWQIDIAQFDVYYDPENETSMEHFYTLVQDGLTFSTAEPNYDKVWDSKPLEEGEYVFVQYYKVVGNSLFVRADSVASFVSVVYL